MRLASLSVVVRKGKPSTEEIEVSTSLQELLDSAEFAVDVEGQRKALKLDYSIWQDPLNLLEEIEDSAEIEPARMSGEKSCPWEEAKAELHATSIESR